MHIELSYGKDQAEFIKINEIPQQGSCELLS